MTKLEEFFMEKGEIFWASPQGLHVFCPKLNTFVKKKDKVGVLQTYEVDPLGNERNIKDKKPPVPPKEFFEGPEDYLIGTFLNLTMKPLEELRQKKLIGGKLEAAINIYAKRISNPNRIHCLEHYDYSFFYLWNCPTKFCGSFLKKILQVSEVNVILDESRVYNPLVGNFKIEAISLRDNENYSKCPRCRHFHKRKNCWSQIDEDNKVGYICEKCEELMKKDYPDDKVTLEILEMI